MAFGRAKKPPTPLAEPALYDYAVKALGRRMRTESELRCSMHSRAEPGEHGHAAIMSALTRLRENGYLNDAAYAEIYTRLRVENEKTGANVKVRPVEARRERRSFRHRAEGQSMIATPVPDEEVLARAHLERKRIRKPESEKETTRVVRRLVSAGFSTGVIFKILRNWNVPDEALAALETLDEDSPPE